jgi:hypothetical protein
MVYMQSGETQQSMSTSTPLLKKKDATHSKNHDTTHIKQHDASHSEPHSWTSLIPSLVVGTICFVLMCVGVYMGGLEQTVQVTLIAVGCLGMALSIVYAYMTGGCDCLCSS